MEGATRRGRAWKFGDDVPIDGAIMPMRLVNERVRDPQILAQHVMEGIDPEFPRKVRPGDFIVAGKQFAHGNPHVQGWHGIRQLGLSVLAVWMPRGAFRSAVVAGVSCLPSCPDLATFVRHGDELDVNFDTGYVKNLTTGEYRQYQPMPGLLRDMIKAGGSVAYLKRRSA